VSAACGTCARLDSSGWPLGAEGTTAAATPAVASPRQWARLLLEFAVIVGLFHGMASSLGSDRGQAGLVIGLVVVGVTLLATRAWPRQTLGSAIHVLGLVAPRGGGLLVALGTCATLGVVVAGVANLTGMALRIDTSALPLLLGLSAQAGVAEEVIFRGYLFGRLREGRTFWRAAGLSVAPFACVHLPLFATMPWPVALAAVLLSIALSVPLAYLFELGGGTIWPPAVLHAVIQAVPKVLVISGEAAAAFPLVWMAASAIVSACVLLIDRPSSHI
jgi:membrane protease YdiL (CAAX protease family)